MIQRYLTIESKKYQINVGSVGQPRDGDPRSSYCIYDIGACRVVNRRVDYDIKTAQEKILKVAQFLHGFAQI